MHAYGEDAAELRSARPRNDDAIDARSRQFSFIVEGNVCVGGSASHPRKEEAQRERHLLGRALRIPRRLDKRASSVHTEVGTACFAESSSLKALSPLQYRVAWEAQLSFSRHKKGTPNAV